MQDVFPEVQAAAPVLRERIRLLKAEIAPMKEIVDAKEKLIRHWQYTLHQLLPTSEPDPYDFLFGLRPTPLNPQPLRRPTPKEIANAQSTSLTRHGRDRGAP